MTRQQRRCLFGGALFAAGVMTSAATAQDFTFQYSYIYTGAFDYPGFVNQDYQFAFGPGPLSAIASVPGANATVDLNSQSISNFATSNRGYVAGGLVFFSYFGVTSDVVVDISWDFSGDEGPGGNWIDSALDIIDLSTNTTIFAADLSNPVGSAQVALSAGTDYFLNGLALAYEGSDGTSYWNIVIPAPSSVGLLAMAGLLAARRRR